MLSRVVSNLFTGCPKQKNRVTTIYRSMADCAELRKVLVLYTGGTFGMKRNQDGVLVPAPNILTRTIKTWPEMHDTELARVHSVRDPELMTKITSSAKAIAYRIREYDPLLDSSNMTPKDWVTIAKDIEENYNDFDGFLIINGTDTLAYISSALSFMFRNLQKPIIVTGAQVPIYDNPNDAKNNFLSALMFASCSGIPEVCVFFSNKLMRGNRVRKAHTWQSIDTFASPNYPELAQSGFYSRVDQNLIISRNEKNCKLQTFTNLNEAVGIFYVFPTVTCTQILSFLEPPLEGVVLVAYGAGNIPSHRQDVLDVLKNAVGRGVTIVCVTQCWMGSVSTAYKTGKCMEEIGILSGRDMTIEAAYTKLCVVCGMAKRPEERAELMKQNFRGEMTIPNGSCED